jgi:hypothetical protein
MQYSIKAFIKREDGGLYLAECLDVELTVRGVSLDETVEKLKDEICKRFDGADMASLGFVEQPTLFITFEDVALPLPVR